AAYTHQPETRRHLLIGDHAALPAIAAALESMDADASGLALIHLDHEEDRLELERPDGVELRWVIGPQEALVRTVQELDLTDHEDRRCSATSSAAPRSSCGRCWSRTPASRAPRSRSPPTGRWAASRTSSRPRSA